MDLVVAVDDLAVGVIDDGRVEELVRVDRLDDPRHQGGVELPGQLRQLLTLAVVLQLPVDVDHVLRPQDQIDRKLDIARRLEMAFEHLPLVGVSGPGPLLAPALHDGDGDLTRRLGARCDLGSAIGRSHRSRGRSRRDPAAVDQSRQDHPDQHGHRHEEHAPEHAHHVEQRPTGLAHGDRRQGHPAEWEGPAGPLSEHERAG